MGRGTHYRGRYAFDLSPRQREVLELIARGRTNGEIAEELDISLDGVKWHVREILGKAGVDSREEAAELWRASRGPAARLRGMLPALFAWLSWRVAVAGGVAAVAVVAGVVVYGSMHGDSPKPGTAVAARSPSVATTATTSTLPAVESGTVEPTPTRACKPYQLNMTVAADKEAATGLDKLDVFFSNTGRECIVQGTMTLTLMANGKPLAAVNPNPIYFNSGQEVQGGTPAAPGKMGAEIAQWVNWCSGEIVVTLDAELQPGGLNASVPVTETPACTDPANGSVLRVPTGGPPGGVFRQVTPTPTPPPFAMQAPCDLDLLRANLSMQGATQHLAIAVQAQNDAAVACTFIGDVVMTLEDNGQPFDSPANPAMVQVTANLPAHGEAFVGSGYWPDRCEPGDAMSVVVKLVTVRGATDEATLPLAGPCQSAGQPAMFGMFADGSVPYGVAPCDPSQLTLKAQAQGTHATELVAASITLAGVTPCWLTGAFEYAISPGPTGGDEIVGNEADLPVSMLLLPGENALGATALWSNWCGSTQSNVATVSLVGTALTSEAKGPPAGCLATDQPSQLKLSPGFVPVGPG